MSSDGAPRLAPADTGIIVGVGIGVGSSAWKKGVSLPSYIQAVCALRFLYSNTLHLFAGLVGASTQGASRGFAAATDRGGARWARTPCSIESPPGATLLKPGKNRSASGARWRKGRDGEREAGRRFVPLRLKRAAYGRRQAPLTPGRHEQIPAECGKL